MYKAHHICSFLMSH